jgi:hypothetical protein
MTDGEFAKFLAEANTELHHKQARLQTDYSLGELPRWWFDQQTETLEFLDDTGNLLLEARVINVGSFSPVSNTWKWAWSNSTVLPALRAKAMPLRQLEDITGFEVFGSAQAFEADESMAWELAAVAVRHLHGMGCYRAPQTQGPHNFLAIVSIRKKEM